MARLEIYVDGASRGNPGPSGIGILIKDHKGNDLVRCGKFLGETTSNVAEYSALTRALKILMRQEKDTDSINLLIKSDSELMINQLTGAYRIRSKNLIPLVIEARRLLKRFKGAEFQLLSRAANKVADKLANKSMNLQEDIDELRETIKAL